MMTPPQFLAVALCQVIIFASAAPVEHSGFPVRLDKIDAYLERNHGWAIQQKRAFRDGRHFSLLQLGQSRVTRLANIRLHDQVLASKKLGTIITIFPEKVCFEEVMA